MQGKRGSKQSEQNLAMLGHELFSVLNGIQGMTELLVATRLNGEQKQFLEAVDLSIRQLHWLIGGIDSQGRGAVFPLSARICEFDGPVLLEQAVRCHTRAALKKNNLLLLVIDPQLSHRWFADSRLLRQVIDNLLRNAIKFTQSGLVVIEARRPAEESNRDTGLELLVRDTGIGFSKAVSRKIFKPFEQADRGIGPIYGGTGLGLHICRKLIKRLNGRLDCVSKPDLGSSFIVHLPNTIERVSFEPREMNTGLFSNMVCRVSVQNELGRSLEFILRRMGIALESRIDGKRPGSDVDFRVEISQKAPCSHDAPIDHCLIFTPGPAGSNLGPSSHIRRMQPPFLSSTLGPLLMEMALEQKFNAG